MKYLKKYSIVNGLKIWKQWVRNGNAYCGPVPVVKIHRLEALIGPETINTIPIETLEAFNDHGKAESHLEDDLDKATQLLTQLKKNGIDINTITQKLEDEGIEKFNNAYDKLLEAIENQKRQVIY